VQTVIVNEDRAPPAALATDLDGSYERVVLGYQDRLFAFALRMWAWGLLRRALRGGEEVR
jgi:hypothetical protein